MEFTQAQSSDSSATLYDALMKRRDEQRREKEGAVRVIKGVAVPYEVNPQGTMQWYLHPNIPNQAVRSELFYIQTLAPSGRSGKQHHPGGVLFYFWKGRGHTVIDDITFSWVERELIQLPHRVDGCVFQHFNDSDEEESRIVVAELNFVESLGVDRGSGWEQLEDAPEYSA